MQIEIEETTKTAIEIQTPYYSKSAITCYKFTENGVIVITDNCIAYFTYGIGFYYKNSTPCTREEVESKFKEVINNLKNKI